MNAFLISLALYVAASVLAAAQPANLTNLFVRVSPRDCRYFELSDGRPYIPIGLNMIAPPGNDFAQFTAWLDRLSENGGNFIRVWLGHTYFDVEHSRSGVYDKNKAQRIDRLLEEAGRRGIRVKMCLESFRHFGTQRQPWSSKPMHLASVGGPATNIADFFDGTASREQFKRKLRWYAGRYRAEPAVFGWELWNEINAVAGGDYMAWSEAMLPELHRLFPRNLAMQSLGSFDTERVDRTYRRLCTMPGNDVAQVHRYLDLGASLAVCHGPVDLLAAEAVRRAISYGPGRPVLLAESGAVEPRHTGPFKLYAKDVEGMILHDVLFAPFFCGAAGPGHIWHWDAYVARQDLWRHFRAFAEVVRDLDPAAEAFEPGMIEDSRLRIYVLKGKRTILGWCRDSQNDWQAELAEGKPPQVITGKVISLARVGLGGKGRARTFDPWTQRWSEANFTGEGHGDGLQVPTFKRSIVFRIARQP